VVWFEGRHDSHDNTGLSAVSAVFWGRIAVLVRGDRAITRIGFAFGDFFKDKRCAGEYKVLLDA